MDGIDVLRHLVATLAYRAAKAVRDVPAEFPHASVSPNTRRPILIVAHLADLMAWRYRSPTADPSGPQAVATIGMKRSNASSPGSKRSIGDSCRHHLRPSRFRS